MHPKLVRDGEKKMQTSTAVMLSIAVVACAFSTVMACVGSYREWNRVSASMRVIPTTTVGVPVVDAVDATHDSFSEDLPVAQEANAV